MAKKHFLLPSRLVNKIPALRTFVWVLEATVLKSLIGLIRLLPPERAYGFANALFRGLKPVLPFTRKIRRNLTIAFPHKDLQEIERLARAICGNLGRAAVDLVLAQRIWAAREERIEFVMENGVDLASYRGRPAVLVGGHIGAWQYSIFVAAHYGLDITTVFAPEENPYLKAYLTGLRAGLGGHFVSRNGCMRHLSKELKQGHLVGYIADTRSDDGQAVPFFGTLIAANTSAARLAIRYHCDLIPVRCERLDGVRFRLTVHRPIRPADPEAPVAEQARQMTAALFRHFEDWIRQDPSQWMCFSQRWPKEAHEG